MEMPFFKTIDKLPEDKEYVLVHLVRYNRRDEDDPDGKQNWTVAKFVKGISLAERDAMKRGEIPDPVMTGWDSFISLGGSKRSSIYRACDEGSNNLVPYAWEPFGPGYYFGQEVDVWAPLPTSVANCT